MINDEKNIVVVDDEQYVCNIIREALEECRGFHIFNFTDPAEAIEFIEHNNVDLVLTDLVMGAESGIQVLKETLRHHPDAVVILMTGYPTVKTAISTLKKGAYDYLIKPFKLDNLKSTIWRGLEHQRIKRENVKLRSQLELLKISEAMAGGMKLYPLLNIITNCAIKEVAARAASIILLDRKADRYRLRCLSGEKTDPAAFDFLHGQGPQGALRHDNTRPHLHNEEKTIDGATQKRSFLSYPLIAKGKNIGFLNLVCVDRFRFITPGQEHLVSLLASTVALAADGHYMDRNLQKSYMMTIKALANAVEARDFYTAGHTARVYRVAKMTAREMGWEGEDIINLRTGCILHDIGKIGVPDAILNKPGRLTAEERETMQAHPELGAGILRGIPFLDPVIPYIISHHERFDGTGYPYGLQGERIPIEGRLLAVADTFDAIVSDRPYRASADIATAVSEIEKYRGIQFDPRIVDAFLDGLKNRRVNFDVLYKKKTAPHSIPAKKQKALV